MNDFLLELRYRIGMAKQRSNSAKKKLGGQPFRTVTERKEFVDNIRKEVLGRLETARAMEEFTKSEEYSFFKEKFKKECSVATDLILTILFTFL